MRKITFIVALMATFAVVGMETNSAQAQTAFGLSIGGPAVRFNVSTYDPYYYGGKRYAGSRGYDSRRYNSRRVDYVPARAVPRGEFCPSRFDRRGFDPRFDSRRRF